MKNPWRKTAAVKRRRPFLIAFTGLAVALSLTSAACASQSDREYRASKISASPVSITKVIRGERVRLDAPIGEPIGLAVWFHGRGGDENGSMDKNWLKAMRAAGWYVASGSMEPTGWGSPSSVMDAARLIEWAQGVSGYESTLFIAASMGGLTSLGAMATHDFAPRCWYGTEPVTDLSEVSGVADSKKQIEESWDGLTPISPIDRVDDLPQNVLYKFRYSMEDTKVPAEGNSIPMIEKLRLAGATVYTSRASGQHNDESHFEVNDLASFALDCQSPN